MSVWRTHKKAAAEMKLFAAEFPDRGYEIKVHDYYAPFGTKAYQPVMTQASFAKLVKQEERKQTK